MNHPIPTPIGPTTPNVRIIKNAIEVFVPYLAQEMPRAKLSAHLWSNMAIVRFNEAAKFVYTPIAIPSKIPSIEKANNKITGTEPLLASLGLFYYSF